MSFPPPGVAGWSTFLAAAAYTAFVLRLAWAGRGQRVQAAAPLLFGAALAASACWGWLGMAAFYVDGFPHVAIALTDLMRYGFWYAFLLSLLAPVIAARRQRGIVLLVPVAVLLVLFGLTMAALGDALGDAAGTATARGRIALYGALALPVFGLILVEQLFRNVADNSRWNAKPLCLGLAVLFSFDIYVYSQAVLFNRPDNDALNIRGTIHAFVVPLLYIASYRRSDWITRLQISRTAAFHSAALIIAGIYLLIVAAVGYYIRFFGGEWGAAVRLAALFVAAALLAAFGMSGTMRSRLRVQVRKHFFRYRYDYREEWLRFTAMLSARSSPAEMGALVIRGVADMVESPGGALWLRDAGQPEFVQAACWNAAAVADREPVGSAFSEFLCRTGWIVDLEQARLNPAGYPGYAEPAWLATAHRYWIVIPLIVADELIGFVALDRPRTPIDLNWEVTDLLKTASRQAAGFLAQMRSTEALLEARKFDAFNRMSAFVVHDLKNIVTQLGLMMRNAKRLHANPEFQRDMLATVEASLEKMRQLMLQLREGEAPPGGVSGVELAPIVRRIAAVAAERGRRVEVDVLEAVVTRGHEQRIERVLGHVVQNALDATRPTDRVWLRVGRRSGQAQVEVGDTGSGMDQDYVRNRLFKPFQTTKATGMGIGAYESFQYVRELGGTIDVDSEPGRGTLMTIVLPLFESRPVSDLHMSSVH